MDYLLGRTDAPDPAGKSITEKNETTFRESPTQDLLLLAELDDMLKQVPGGLTEEERESLLRHNRIAIRLMEEERQRRKEGKTNN